MGYKRIANIYCIKNNVNGKLYFGRSSYLGKRIAEHKKTLKNGSHYNNYLQRAWDKYGENSFEFSVIKKCSHDDLDYWERYFINKHETNKPEFGYNLDSGGSFDYSHSDETIEKIRNAHIGMMHSEESKKKISKNNKMRGKTGSKHPFFGKTHSDLVKDKLRKLLSREGSPVFGKKYKDSASKYYGVSIKNHKVKHGTKEYFSKYWMSQIRVDKKQYRLGYFKDEISAARKYDGFVISNKLKNPLNFPKTLHLLNIDILFLLYNFWKKRTNITFD